MDEANVLQARLNQLEGYLKHLVEDSLVRLFTSQQVPFNLSSMKFRVVQFQTNLDEEGNLIASDRYTLFVHPEELPQLKSRSGMLEELVASIQEAGLQTGLHFASPPTIQMVAHSGIPHREVHIVAEVSPQPSGKTTTMVIESERKTEMPPPNAFLMLEGTHLYHLTHPVVNIGRRPDNHLVIHDQRVSRLHAQLRAVHGAYVIFDLDSTGGTFVNGRRIKEHRLQPGDVISLAGVQMIYGQETSYPMEDDRESTRPFEP